MDLRHFAGRFSDVHWLGEDRFKARCPLAGHPDGDAECSLVARLSDGRIQVACFSGLAHSGSILAALHLTPADLRVAIPEAPASPPAVLGNGMARSLEDQWKNWKVIISHLVTRDFQEAIKSASGRNMMLNTPPPELDNSAVNNVLAVIDSGQQLFQPPEKLNRSELEQRIRPVAVGTIEDELSKYRSKLPAGPSVVSIDPIVKEVEQALSRIVTPTSIEFLKTSAYLDNVRTFRGKQRVITEQLARSHSVGMIVGRAWHGKTTIAANLTRARVLNEMFLGYQCHSCRVGYMGLERNAADVAQLFENWNVADAIQFVDSVPMGDPREMALALAYAIRHYELEVVTVDHLIGLIHMTDGNDYVGVSQALMPFSVVAKMTGAYIELLHHRPKAATTGNEINVMGSEAFRAATDTLMEASKIGNNYFFRAQMRGSADIERVRVTRSEEGLLAGEDSVEGVRLEILSALEGLDKEISKASLIKQCPELEQFHPKSILRALRALEDAGLVAREKKRGTFVYWIPENQPQQGNLPINSGENQKIEPEQEVLGQSNRVTGVTNKNTGYPTADDDDDLDEYEISRSK